MIYANTIVIATIGIVFTRQNADDLRLFRVLLALLGIALCSMWILIVRRSFDYHDYWIFCARELELSLPEEARFISRGKRFGAGETISFRPYGELRIGFRRLKSKWLSYGIIVVFIALYGATCLVSAGSTSPLPQPSTPPGAEKPTSKPEATTPPLSLLIIKGCRSRERRHSRWCSSAVTALDCQPTNTNSRSAI